MEPAILTSTLTLCPLCHPSDGRQTDSTHFKKLRPYVSGMCWHSGGDGLPLCLFGISSNFLHGFIKRGPVNSFHTTCCCNSALKITFLPFAEVSVWPEKTLSSRRFPPLQRLGGNFPLHESKSQATQIQPPKRERVHRHRHPSQDGVRGILGP